MTQTVILLFTLLCATGAASQANPAIPLYGYGSIIPSSSPVVAGEVTDITVVVQNTGPVAAKDVLVTLSFNEGFGVTFGGWQEIRTETVGIDANGSTSVTFSHVFASAAHTSLEVIITAQDNARTQDDRGQVNLEVVSGGEDFTHFVPIRNNKEVDMAVQVTAFCVIAREKRLDQVLRRVPCPFELNLDVPGLDRGRLNLPAGEAALVRVNGTALQSNNKATYHVAVTDDALSRATRNGDGTYYVAVQPEALLQAASNGDQTYYTELATEALARAENSESPGSTVTTDHDGAYYLALQTEPLTAKIQNDDGTFSVAVTDEALARAANSNKSADGIFYVALQTEALVARVAPGYSVMVEAVDISTGERSHVVLTRFSTTVQTLLNLPQLCCIADLRVRLYLELSLARALTLYELHTAPAIKLAVQLLREFIMRAEETACDAPSPEKACLEKAKGSMAAAARMMSLELAQLLAEEGASGVGRMLEERLASGDELRQEGELQAAVLTYLTAAAPAAKQALVPNANWTMAVAGFSGKMGPSEQGTGGVFGAEADKRRLPPRRWTHVAVSHSSE